MAHVYILTTSSGKYYIGNTSNLEERVTHHKGGYTPSSKKMGKISLIFSQEYNTLKDARSVERKLKKLKRRDYIEKIISEGIIRLKP